MGMRFSITDSGIGLAVRSLRCLWQEAKILPWQREQWPLIYCGEELVCISGVGVACGWQAQDGESGWVIDWVSAC